MQVLKSMSRMNKSVKSNKPFLVHCPVSQDGWCQNRWGQRQSLGRREASRCHNMETLKHRKNKTLNNIQIKFGWCSKPLRKNLGHANLHTPKFMQQNCDHIFSSYFYIFDQPAEILESSFICSYTDLIYCCMLFWDHLNRNTDPEKSLSPLFNLTEDTFLV